MSSQSDDPDSDAAAAFLIAVPIVALVFTFLAFVFTLVAFAAWFRPVRLGKLMVEPEQARAFVKRGIGGAILLVVFAGFLGALFGIPMPDEAGKFIALAGYVGGSIGVETWLYKVREQENAGSSASAVPEVQKPAFRYASWDDEERS